MDHFASLLGNHWISTAPAVAAFTVALLGSGHCAGMCGGLVRLAQGRDPNLVTLSLYHVGRIATYSLLGGVIGALGGGFLLQLKPEVSKVALLLLAMGSAWSAYRIIRPAPTLNTLTRLLHRISEFFFRQGDRTSYRGSLFFGIGTAFLPCGFLWGFLIASAASSGAIAGATIMIAFGLGTLPALGAFQWLSQKLERKVSPQISATLWLSISLLSFAAQAGLLKKRAENPPNQPVSENQVIREAPHSCH